MKITTVSINYEEQHDRNNTKGKIHLVKDGINLLEEGEDPLVTLVHGLMIHTFADGNLSIEVNLKNESKEKDFGKLFSLFANKKNQVKELSKLLRYDAIYKLADIIKDHEVTKTRKYFSRHFFYKEPLTNREKEVLKLLLENKILKEIAAILFLSIDGVKKHKAAIYKKFGVHGIAALHKLALKNNLYAMFNPVK